MNYEVLESQQLPCIINYNIYAQKINTDETSTENINFLPCPFDFDNCPTYNKNIYTLSNLIIVRQTDQTSLS